MEGRSKYILVLTPTRRGCRAEDVILDFLRVIEFEGIKAVTSEDPMVVWEYACEGGNGEARAKF